MKELNMLFWEEDAGGGGGGGDVAAPAAPASGPGALLSGEGAPAATPAPAGGDGTPAATGAFTGLIGDDGAFSDGWIDKLPEDLRAHSGILAKYKSLPELVKGSANALGMATRKGAVVPTPPGENASEQEKLLYEQSVTEYRKAVGAPESADKYELFPEGAQLPEGVEISPELSKGFSEIAHKHHVPQAAMQELALKYAEIEGQRVGAAQEYARQQMDQHAQELQKAWGDKFAINSAHAQRAAREFEFPLDSDDPKDVLNLLANIGMKMKEDAFTPGHNGEMSNKTKAELVRGTQPIDHFPELAVMRQRWMEGDQETVKKLLAWTE